MKKTLSTFGGRAETSLAVVFLLGAGACGSEDPLATSSWPLLEDRTMLVETSVEGSFTSVEIRVADGADETAALLLETVRRNCEEEILPRFAVSGPNPCGLNAAREQQINLCAAHQYLGFAEAIAPTDIFVDTQSGPEPVATLRLRRPGDSLEEPELGTRLMTVPVQSASGSASAAMASTFLVQQALVWGAAALDEAVCPEGALAVSIPGPNDTPTPLSFVIASATNEAGQLALEAAEKTEQYVVAAATARMANDSDESRARILGWRGRNDSRLEPPPHQRSSGYPPRARTERSARWCTPPSDQRGDRPA